MGIHKEYVLHGLLIHRALTPEYTLWKERLIEACGEEIVGHVINVRRWVIGHERPGKPVFCRQPNCWEFMGCDDELPCPARIVKKHNGMHGGLNAGRACWLVQGTRCGNGVQGTPEEKKAQCAGCDFLRAVREEEGLSETTGPVW